MNHPIRRFDGSSAASIFDTDELWIRGALPDRERPAVAIVGARLASGEAMRLCQRMAPAVAKFGGEIWSGGAIGIDTAAHVGALAAGVPTFAVLACGLDRLYPERNLELFERMCDAGGGVLSTYPPGTAPRPGQFLRRNHLLAARAELVLVIEASDRSGALSTARAARRLRRTVVAVPGSPGCDQLIGEGAGIVQSPDDLFAALEGRALALPAPHHVDLPGPGTVEADVLAELEGHAARSPEMVALGTGIPFRKVLMSLAGLELAGLVTQGDDRQYIRSELAQRLSENG